MLLTLLLSWAAAHPKDEYLQAAYLNLSPAAVELQLDLTAGENVAAQMLKQMDQNSDGSLSGAEVERYAAGLLGDLSLQVDGKAQGFKLVSVTTPGTEVFLAGGGTIQVLARAVLPDQHGRHTLEFRNAHAPLGSAYLANAFVKSERVKLHTQKRNADYSGYRLEYSLAPGPGPSLPVGAVLVFLAVVFLASAWTLWRYRSLRNL
jgi:hypothetical protein